MLSKESRGVLIAVRAVPRAGKSAIAGVRAGALLVRLAAAPVEGAANAELIEVLAAALGFPKRHITVVAGERGRDKRVLVEGATLETIQQRLSAILGRS